MGLHNVIRRSNILDEDFFDEISEHEDMSKKHESNHDGIDEIEEAEAMRDGVYMATIHNQIADMLRADRR